MRHTFTKSERICGKTETDRLFSKGRSFTEFPLRCVYLLLPEDEAATTAGSTPSPAAVMVSVGKKYHKRAVARNRIKRLLRESFRLNKHSLYGHIPQGRKLHLAFLYISKEKTDYQTIEGCVKRSIEKIGKQIQGNSD